LLVKATVTALPAVAVAAPAVLDELARAVETAPYGGPIRGFSS
jgi:hypothetical protein